MIEVSNVAEQAGIGRYIPKSVLERRTVLDPQTDWATFLGSLMDRVDRADTQANIARHRKWLTVMRFFMGEQLGYVNDAGAWQTITRNPGDPLYVVNFLQYFVNALLKDYVRSQAQLDVVSRGNRMNMRLAARPASEMLKLIQSDQITPTAIERDGKFAILMGNTFRYTVCTANTGKYRREPVTEKVRIQLMGSSSVCLECGGITEVDLPDQMASGEMVGEVPCQQCGSELTEIVQGAETDITQIKGFEQRMTPDVETTIVDPFEIKLPLSADNERLAGWLRRERYVDYTKLRTAFPWAELSENASQNFGETPLLAQAQIRQSPGNVGGYATSYNLSPTQMELRRFSQYWFRPEEYAHWIWEEDEEMANGEVIPAGTRALDLFPNGLYVARNGQTLLETAPENKDDVWVMNRWEVVPNAIWAYGIDHVIQAQEINNEVFSLVYEHIMHNTTPPTILDPNFLRRSDWTNKPGFVAVLRKGAPTGGVQQAFAQPSPRPLGGDTFGFLEMLKGDMQLLSGGAFSSASGLPDVHTNTLGGMQIQRDQALAQHISKLNRKAEADVRTGLQQLRIVKKHNLAQFYYPRLSDFSEYELQQFNECDLDADLDVRHREGSQYPRSALEQRGNLEAALMMGGMPLGVWNPEMPRSVRKLALELLNLPTESEQIGADERNTLLNIVHLMEFAQMNEMDETGQPIENVQPNPEEALMMAATIAPVRYRVDDHPVCIETVVDFLKTDAGRHLSPIAELLLNDLITRHKKAMEMKMMEDSVTAMILNPMMPMAAPGTPNPQMALPAPMPGSPPQQQMSGQPTPGQQSPRQTAMAASMGGRPTPQSP